MHAVVISRDAVCSCSWVVSYILTNGRSHSNSSRFQTWFKSGSSSHEHEHEHVSYDTPVSASSSFELLETGTFLKTTHEESMLYPEGSTIDWQREEAAERERKRVQVTQRGLRGMLAPILDSSRMWLVIVLTGVGIGVAGAWLDVLVRW